MSGAVEGVEAHARELAHRIIMEFRPNGWEAKENELYRLLLGSFEHLTPPPARSYADGEVERLTAERDFLRLRAGHAGRCVFGGKRWTGESSNALVDIAFGEASNGLPYDSSDLAACYRMLQRLPRHLLSAEVLDHLERGEAFVGDRHPGSLEWARADAEWEGADHYRALLSQGGKA